MEITGTITRILDERSGVSKTTNNPWKLQQYLIEPSTPQAKPIMFEVFGEDKIKEMNIQQGELLTVHIDLDAREFQGRWFTQVRAWKVERTTGVAGDTTQLPPAQPFPPISSNPPGPFNDLPFDNDNSVLPF